MYRYGLVNLEQLIGGRDEGHIGKAVLQTLRRIRNLTTIQNFQLGSSDKALAQLLTSTCIFNTHYKNMPDTHDVHLYHISTDEWPRNRR